MHRSICLVIVAAAACDSGRVARPVPARHDAAGSPLLAIDGHVTMPPDAARLVDAGLPPGMLYAGGAEWLAIDGDDLYFTSTDITGAIMRVSKHGGAPTKLATDDRIAWSRGIAVGRIDVFWTSETGLKKVAKAGGPVIELDQREPSAGPVLDGTNVYWVANDLLAMPIVGGKPRRIVESRDVGGGELIALDASNVYWVDGSLNVKTAPKAGGPARTVHVLMAFGPDSAAGPFRSAVATDRDSVYACDPVKRIPKHGGKVQILDDRLGDCTAIAVGRDDIYTITDHTLVAYPKIGGAQTVIATDLGDSSHLAIDGTTLYWTAGDGIHDLATP